MAAKTPPAIRRGRPPVWLTTLTWVALHTFPIQSPVLAAVPPDGSCIGARTLHEGDIALKPGGAIAFTVDVADSMCDPRLEVYLTGRNGARTEFDLSLRCVFEDIASTPDGDGRAYAPFNFYRSESVLDHASLAPGRYEVRLENSSRHIGPQTLRGFIRLTWIRDAARVAANAMKRRVRFSGLPEKLPQSYLLRSSTGLIRLDLVRDPEWHLVVPVRDHQGRPTRSPPIESDYVTDVGILDHDLDGHEELILVTASGGSGGIATTLYLYLPKPAVLVHSTEELSATNYPRAVGFLDSLSRAYQESEDDWVRAGDDDLRFAFEEWTEVNGDIGNDKMTIRRYFGLPYAWEQGDVVLRRGSLVFASIFKAGVVAYDTRRDEHFVVFNPYDQYAWASRMEVMDEYLIIHSQESTLAVVDLRTFHLYKLDLDEIGEGGESRLRVVRGRLLVRGVDIDHFAARIPARGPSD